MDAPLKTERPERKCGQRVPSEPRPDIRIKHAHLSDIRPFGPFTCAHCQGEIEGAYAVYCAGSWLGPRCARSVYRLRRTGPSLYMTPEPRGELVG